MRVTRVRDGASGRARGRWPVAVIAAACVALTACEVPGTSSAADRPAGDTTSADAAAGGSSTPSEEEKEEPRTLDWVPFGPSSPDTPSAPYRVYAMLQSDCSRAVDLPASEGMTGDEAAFWKAAALACVALRDADDESWRAAVESWDEGGKQYSGTGCQVDLVRATAVAIFGETPTADKRPDLVLGGAAGGLACPPQELSLSPGSGAAGTAVTLSWSGAPWMHYSGAILFGDAPASLLGDSSSEATVTAPPSPGAGPVPVTLELSDGQTLSFGSFTYSED